MLMKCANYKCVIESVACLNRAVKATYSVGFQKRSFSLKFCCVGCMNDYDDRWDMWEHIVK